MYRLSSLVLCTVFVAGCNTTLPSDMKPISTSSISAVTSSTATSVQTSSMRFTNCRQFASLYDEPNTVTTISVYGRTVSVPFNASWPFPDVEVIEKQSFFGMQRPSSPADECTMYRDFVAIQTASRSMDEAIESYSVALQIPKTSIQTGMQGDIQYMWVQAKTADCTAPVAEIIGTDTNIVLTMPCSAALFYNEPMLQFMAVLESIR